MNTPNSPNPMTPDELEQNLRIKELKLKVRDLKTPPFKKVATWTGMGAITLALIGAVLQGVASNARSQLEELRMKDLEAKKLEATNTLAKMTTTLRLSKDSLEIIRQQYGDQQARIADAKLQLDKINGLIASLNDHPSSKPNQSREKITEIKDVIRGTRQDLSTETQSKPSVLSDTTRKSTQPTVGNINLYPNDPQKGKWGMKAEQNGRKISANVKHLRGNFYTVTITVTSTDSSKPLSDKVIFHLHDTFMNQNPSINVENGKAVLILKSYGAFTVGAEADGGKTKLELDLAELSDADAPKDFKSR